MSRRRTESPVGLSGPLRQAAHWFLIATLLGCSAAPSPDGSGPSPSADTETQPLRLLARAWGHGDEAAAAALADPGDFLAQDLLATAARNARVLGMREIGVESVGNGVARVSWRIPRFDSGRSQVSLRLRSTSAQSIAMHPGAISPSPLWLTEPLEVVRSGQVLVLGSAGDALDRILRDSLRAHHNVRRAWPTWDGRLVVEVASSQQRMAAALGRPEAAYDGIAAVTSSSDGSRGATTPVHVFVNPEVYAGMSAAAAQIVMTHEVVHVATRAPVSKVPLWWAEGLAEHVGFASVNSPLARRLGVAATADLTARIARVGAPRALPSPADFDSPERDAAYASARVAVAVLAYAGGGSPEESAEALLSFQVLLASGVTEREAVPAVFEISRDVFVRRWRERLVGLVASL